MAELKAIAIGLVMAMNFRSSCLIVDSDSRGAIDFISSQKACMKEFGSILKGIAELANGVEVCYNFIPHTCNSVSNGLAHYAFCFCSSENCDSLFLD